jgi:HSP20 family protein
MQTRSFYLSLTINQEAMKANYRDGILELHMPKSEEPKPKQIAINFNYHAKAAAS